MPVWEYKVLYVRFGTEEATLNGLRAAGWEFVSALPSQGTSQATLLFKRPAKE